jgi:peroxiredoxin
VWIIFDEEDRRIPAPRFCLEALGDRQVCVDEYCEDCNLVLVFTHTLECEACLELLQSFSGRLQEYALADGQILAVLPERLEVLEGVPALLELPFPVLADPGGRVRQAYAGLMDESLVKESDTLLFVLDVYGAPYSAFVTAESGLHSPTLHEDVLKWLEFIGVQCPE